MYILTYMHTYIHTYVHTHTYIHIYIHTCIGVAWLVTMRDAKLTTGVRTLVASILHPVKGKFFTFPGDYSTQKVLQKHFYFSICHYSTQ